MLTDEEERIGEVALARGCGRDWLKVMDISPLAGKEYYENRRSIGMVKFVMYFFIRHTNSTTCICDQCTVIFYQIAGNYKALKGAVRQNLKCHNCLDGCSYKERLTCLTGTDLCTLEKSADGHSESTDDCV